MATAISFLAGCGSSSNASEAAKSAETAGLPPPDFIGTASAPVIAPGLGSGQAPPAGSAGAGYSRPLPETQGRILVWPDQLDTRMTDAQVRFAASHFVGSQKLTYTTSARIRAHAPNFLVFQYRLATGLSTVDNLTSRDTWARDTLEPAKAGEPSPLPDPRRTEEAFYLHHPPGSGTRVHQVDSYFLPDVRNVAWQTHHIDEILRRMPENAFDGIFLDTAHLRIDGFTPSDWHTSFCQPDITRLAECWSPPMRTFFERVVERLHRAEPKYYAIGNYGPLVTGWDKNDYLEPLDGGMIELFMWLGGAPLGEADWHLSVDRILRLIGNDRILIAEPVSYSLDDQRARLWLLGNFLLLQNRFSYAAFYPNGTEATGPPVWLPEYEVELGRPVAPLPATTGRLCTSKPEPRKCGGLYERVYASGRVFVNPATAPRTATLPPAPDGRQWVELTFRGGGYVDAAGKPAPGEILKKETPAGEIPLAGTSARIFQIISK